MHEHMYPAFPQGSNITGYYQRKTKEYNVFFCLLIAHCEIDVVYCFLLLLLIKVGNCIGISMNKGREIEPTKDSSFYIIY